MNPALHFWLAPVALIPLICSTAAFAHGTAERYDLPLPLGYYIAGSTLAVVLSFLVSAVFIYVKSGEAQSAPSAASMPRSRALRIPPSISRAMGGLGLGVFALVIIAGLLGDQHPAKNIAPSLVWVAWWVGLSLFVALIGDVWVLLNPWRRLATMKIVSRITECPRRTYPKRLQEWPAVFALFLFVWIELVSPYGSSPMALAIMSATYTAWILLGVYWFGSAVWLDRGEAFGLVFRMLGRFAPLAVDQQNPDRAVARPSREAWISVRPPGAALLDTNACSNATVALLLLLLSAVLFDGLLGTAFWRAAERLFPLDRDGLAAATCGLALTWLVFLGIYLGACRVMSAIPGSEATALTLFRRYALTLVPIAIGYNLAHNFSYLLVQGQALLALASDPLGRGWNLFGTALVEPNIGIVDARTTWYVAIAAIVGGHVVSVVLAHVIGVTSEQSRYRALVRLLPLTAVMIVYTAVSLSIIADPLVRFRAPDPGYS